MPADRRLPLYQSHKRVRALRIKSFRILDHGVARLWFKEDRGWSKPLDTREGWTERFSPHDTDLGIYVEYDDGFTSWSPTKAFDEGYTRIKEPTDGR